MQTRTQRLGIFWLTSVAVLVLLAAVAWFYTARGGWFNPSTAGPEKLSCALPAIDSKHPGMVWVPAGSFDFGDQVYPEEGPIRHTSVQGFWMERTEVTNRAFEAFVKATAYVTVAERPVDRQKHPQLPPDMQQPGAVVFVMPEDLAQSSAAAPWWRYTPGANWQHPGGPQTSIVGKGDFPVVAVTFEDAQAYARWRGHVLPTEAQWEWAARAGSPRTTLQVAAHEQPQDANTWQGLFPLVNSGKDGFIGLAPVACFAPNAFGLYDMIGNVWELTQDVFKPSHEDLAALAKPEQVPSVLNGVAARQRVIKGGSYLCAPNYCMRYRAGARQGQDEDLAVGHLGFRTVLNVPKE